jgi:GNAT superfamily N-acetyltransferase
LKPVMNLKFNNTTKYEPGTVCRLLTESYAEIIDVKLQDQFRRFDREVFEHSETVGACTFITTFNSEIVGMASFDPRQAPELGIIGHNCILPKYRRNEFGKQQIIEILNRLKAKNIKRAAVTSSEHPFFKPAHKMYLSCGFTELKTERKNPDDIYRTICYEMEIK